MLLIAASAIDLTSSEIVVFTEAVFLGASAMFIAFLAGKQPVRRFIFLSRAQASNEWPVGEQDVNLTACIQK